jgi:CheY-like chemotaxis protein
MSSLVLGSQNGSPAERRRKPRILIVDDYPDARTLLAIALQRRGGYEVTAAGSAVEALRLIDERFVRTTDAGSRALDLELLVLDIMMPDMTGLELLQKLRHDFPNLPRVMVISAVDAHERLAEALRLGASEYVSKPIEIDLLLYKVRTMLEEDETSPFHWGSITPGSDIVVGSERGIARAINEGGLWVEMPQGTQLAAGEVISIESAFFQECGLHRRLAGRVLRVRPLEQGVMVELVFVGLAPRSVARIRAFSLAH